MLAAVPGADVVTYVPKSARRANRAGVGVVAIVVALGVAGCGGGSEGTTTSLTPGVAEPTSSTTVLASTEPATQEVSPADLGDTIGQTYVEAIEEVVASLEGRPDASAARATLETLKERYVVTLVELGRLREALSSADRTVVDARIRMRVNAIPADLFGQYESLRAAYAGVDAEVAELIASFNIITQYASFDLLRQQDPDEAARVLGD